MKYQTSKFVVVIYVILFLASCGEKDEIAAQIVNPPLINTHWNLLQVEGVDVKTGFGDMAPFIELTHKGNALGYSGCNRFKGGYSIEGDNLILTPMASTRMICIKYMDQEFKYEVALSKVIFFQIADKKLLLLNKERKIILKFQSGKLD